MTTTKKTKTTTSKTSVDTRNTSRANRGLDLEEIVKKQCDQYLKDGKGYIFKLPTEWTVQRRGKFIVSAFPKAKSLTDFFGVLSTGEAIAIEVKNTNNKTSFPLGNIKDHQFEFLAEWAKYTKHSYYIMRFKEHDEIYLVESTKVQTFKDTETRKSLPYAWFKENAMLLNGCDFLEKIL